MLCKIGSVFLGSPYQKDYSMSWSMSGSRKSTGGNDQVLQSGGSSGVRASESRLRGFHCRVLIGTREWEGEWNFYHAFLVITGATG